MRPAHLGDLVGEPHQLPHRVEGDLRIVGAGLDRQIAAAVAFDQLVADEVRQVDQCFRPPAGEAIAVLAVLDEQAGAEPEGYGQPRRRQPLRVAGVGQRDLRRGRLLAGGDELGRVDAVGSVDIGAVERLDRPPVGKARGGGRPGLQQPTTSPRLVVVRSSAVK